MLGTIISAIIGGLIIGLLARAILPGKQHIGLVKTILVGIVSALIAGLLVQQFGYSNHKGIAWVPIIVSIIVAMIGVSIVASMDAKKGRQLHH